MFCSSCGAQVETAARFCNRCGRSFAADQVPAARTTFAPKKKTSFVTKFLAVVFGISLFFGIIGLLVPKDNSSTTNSQASSSNTDSARPTTATTKTIPLTKAQQRAAEIATRKAYAKIIDQKMLDLGIESKTYTTGADAKTLVINDVLAGRVRVNSLEKNEDLFQQMRALGFKHLRYENGFEDDLYFGVNWDL